MQHSMHVIPSAVGLLPQKVPLLACMQPLPWKGAQLTAAMGGSAVRVQLYGREKSD